MTRVHTAPHEAMDLPATILVADDQEQIRQMVELQLTSAGHKVVIAEDGDVALRLYRECRPDLLLLDIMMPGRDGFSVLEVIRQESADDYVPVVMITALSDTQDKKKAYRLGADDFLNKPIQRVELLAKVKILLRNRRLVGRLQQANAEISKWNETLEERIRVKAEMLKESQQELLQAEKLSSIGRLMAGVSHELNNPLTGVIGYADLLIGDATDPAILPDLQRIQDCASRCHRIVRNLLAFCSERPGEPEVLDINQLIEQYLELERYSLELDGVRVLTELDPDLPQVLVDIGQMREVLVSLMDNSRRALDHVTGDRTISVSSGRDGEYVWFRVEDTGPGVAPEDVDKIFDPFFTTREVGQGAGLGLSAAYGILRQHGGGLRLETPSGQGAAFVASLPTKIAGEHRGRATSSGEQGRSVKSGRANAAQLQLVADRQSNARGAALLVVDDEEIIFQLTKRLLVPQGYSVSWARDGLRGLLSLERGEFQYVLCDIRMPELGGIELFERVRAVRPELAARFIFTTGDHFSKGTAEFIESVDNPSIPKPFAPDTLMEAIDVIDRLQSVA